MRDVLRPYLTIGVLVASLGLVVPPDTLAVRLADVTEDLGHSTALVMGPSGFPIPPERYAETMNELYLHAGSTQIVPTPEGLYPVTGVKSLMLDPSVAQGVQALDNTIQGKISDAGADNPIVVSGFSQSSTVSSQAMQQLASLVNANGQPAVPSDDVHFVLVGDPNAPNGGLMERFNVPIGGHSPTIPSLGITFNGATPSDLYPTDIYTNEYDGFADFPRYPINLLSDINALLGIIFEHATYAVNTPGQIANAILLPGSEDSPTDPCVDCLTNYWMMPTDTLPLLAPLQLIPFIGTPLYDLLAPDMTVLVNLGYGNIGGIGEDGLITGGWDPGPANDPTTFGVFPTDLHWGEVGTALIKGVWQGITDAGKQLLSPDNWHLTPLLENPVLAPLVQAAYAMGLTDSPHPSLMELLQGALGGFANFPISHANLLSPFSDLVNDFTGTLSYDYSTLLPVADVVNALLTTLPSVAFSFITEQLADGHLFQGIGEAVAAGVALIPFALVFGGAPILEAAGGTLTNILQLFDFSDTTP
ncbi:MAG TPA: PE-PPE domain-containing protein [Mycobacterium sp.]|nr:PE-PPE domain-containing protein [Mycobacterium sp.]